MIPVCLTLDFCKLVMTRPPITAIMEPIIASTMRISTRVMPRELLKIVLYFVCIGSPNVSVNIVILFNFSMALLIRGASPFAS